MAPNIDKMDPTEQPGACQIARPTEYNLCPLSINKNELCMECQGIPFGAVLEAVRVSEGDEISPGNVGNVWSRGPIPYHVLEESARSCKLCQFFIESSFEDFLGNPASEHLTRELIAMSLVTTGSWNSAYLKWGDFTTPARRSSGVADYRRPYLKLALQCQDSMTSQERKVYCTRQIQFCRSPRTDCTAVRFRLPTPLVPFDLIRSWLAFCQSHHGLNYSRVENSTPSTLSLRVIDCKSSPREVVPYSSELGIYAALSYVWGFSAEKITIKRPLAPGKLPTVLPRSIEDAIKVTVTLGFRYLWIDQYCIPQDDEDEKRRQIQLMDEIYSRAELTIIAAAGRDASYGLPGVGSTPRKLLRSVQVGVDTLIDIPMDFFKLSNHAATWLSRGWTYQEGILSRRRLLFLDNQVYFQCAEMTVLEAMDVSLENHHYKTWEDRICHASDFLLNSRFGIETLRGAIGVDSSIDSYFSRKLSHSEDAIRAISGIFSHYNKVGSGPAILVLSGLPLYLPMPAGSQIFPTTYALSRALLNALTWFFANSNKLKRREMFPSWTWAGWQEINGFRKAGYTTPDLEYNWGVDLQNIYGPGVQIGISSHENTSQILWKEVHELPWKQHNGQFIAQYIGLRGWTFTAIVLAQEEQIPSGFQGCSGGDFTFVFPGYDMPKKPQLWIHREALGLGSFEYRIELVAMPLRIMMSKGLGEYDFKMYVLLLRSTDKTINSQIIYERVGLPIFYLRKDIFMASEKDADDQQLPPWARGAFQAV